MSGRTKNLHDSPSSSPDAAVEQLVEDLLDVIEDKGIDPKDVMTGESIGARKTKVSIRARVKPSMRAADAGVAGRE